MDSVLIAQTLHNHINSLTKAGLHLNDFLIHTKSASYRFKTKRKKEETPPFYPGRGIWGKSVITKNVC